MIQLHIEAKSIAELHGELLALLAGTAMSGTVPTDLKPQTEPTTGSRRGKKVAQEPEPDTGKPEGVAEDATASAAQSSAAAAAAAAAAANAPITKETLTPRIMALGTKAGPAAAAELFGEFGAKKFSEVKEEQYPALNARLDQLLAG